LISFFFIFDAKYVVFLFFFLITERLRPDGSEDIIGDTMGKEHETAYQDPFDLSYLFSGKMLNDKIGVVDVLEHFSFSE